MFTYIGRFFYIAYALMLFIIIVAIAFFNILVRQRHHHQVFKWCAWVSSTWYKIIGIRLENIYLSKHTINNLSLPCIYVCNHTSYLDIPTMLCSVKHPIYFIAKAELGKKFILGFLTKKISILVKREDMRDRTKSFIQIKSSLQAGNSICIFPEGKINETGKPLLPFQRGSFAIALQTKTPIQPIVLLDTNKRLNIRSLFSLSKGMNRVIYLPIVETKKYQEDDVESLVNHIHTEMEKVLKE